LVLAVACYIQLARMILSLGFVQSILGQETIPEKACNGLECYEVFSCRGFTWTTANILQPMGTITGAIMFPIGVHAALHGYRAEMKVFSWYMMILCTAYIGCFIGDGVYYGTCDAYPADVVKTALLLPIPFPIRRAAQDELMKMAFYPAADVNRITHDFATWGFFVMIETFIVAFLLYSTYEACYLAIFLERGPLGLGVHYGLGQFDEIINHEKLKERKLARSQFVEDCKADWNAELDVPLATGWRIPSKYGAFYGDDGLPAPSRRLADPEDPYPDTDFANDREEAMPRSQEELQEMDHANRDEEALAERAADQVAQEAEEFQSSPQEVQRNLNQILSPFQTKHNMLGTDSINSTANFGYASGFQSQEPRTLPPGRL